MNKEFREKSQGFRIKIGERFVGDECPVFIVAEAADNHMGSIDMAKAMIDVAKNSGADAVKFQHHIPDEEMLPDAPMSENFEEPLYEFLKKRALTIEQHYLLKKYCDEVGILYMCTPFSLKAAKEINPLVCVFKIGSGEMTDIPSLKEIAKIGKPMIMSTGMSTIDEIERTFSEILPINNNIILMNCTSEYPPQYEDINLNVIHTLKNRFKTVIGHSDHTPDNYTCFAAVTMGAKVIEKHFILDKSIKGPDNSVSITPQQLKELVEGIRKIELAMGYEKKINKLEEPIRTWALRSIVAIKEIKGGETFSTENLWSKRPGTGIPSSNLLQIIGKKARRDIPVNTLLSWDDVE
jgi:N-acetylneuraminate synthase